MPGLDGALHRFLETELEPDVEVPQARSGLPQLVLDHLADTGALLHHDQRLGAEIVQRHRLSGKAVIRRADENDLVSEEGLVDDRAVARGGADDAELQLSPSDPVDDRLRVGDREVDRHLGVRLGELTEEHGDDRASRSRRCAQSELTVQRPFGLPGDVLEQLPLLRQQPLRSTVEASPGLSRLDPAARAVEELLPEAVLERADLEAHRRLGDSEPLGCEREALALDDRAEGGQLPGVHQRGGDVRA